MEWTDHYEGGWEAKAGPLTLVARHLDGGETHPSGWRWWVRHNGVTLLRLHTAQVDEHTWAAWDVQVGTYEPTLADAQRKAEEWVRDFHKQLGTALGCTPVEVRP